MGLFDDRTRVTPHQLCHLCHQVVAKYSQDMFWADMFETDNPYRWLERGTIPDLDAPDLGDIAQPLEHHDCLASLEESAAEGCHLCAIYFRRQLSCSDKPCGGLQLYIRLFKRQKFGCPSLLLEMYEGFPPNPVEFSIRWTVEMRHNRCTSQPQNCYRYIDIHPIDSHEEKYKWCTSTDCNESYAMIRYWLQQCVDNHIECGRGLDNVKPTRLLDLAAPLGDQDIRLVLTEDIGEQPYATLSYRWGTVSGVNLMKSNYETFRTRIVLGTLPRSVQEAVRVCRGLSVRYLWVDALCIIQESGADLAREIAQMGSIYAGSLVTVAAANSTHHESGFIRERYPLRREDCIISGTDQEIIFSHELQYDNLNKHLMTLQKSKLNERGWVYQERMLSPRTVHFTAEEVIWECRELCQCYQCAGTSSARVGSSSSHVKNAFIHLHGLSNPATRGEKFPTVWSSILSAYTSTMLSNADDRLSALAGIAQFAIEKLDYNASYGLWLHGFLENLLWWVKPRQTADLASEVEALDHVPSWSWASIQPGLRILDESSPRLRIARSVLYSALITRFPPVTPFGPIRQLSEGLERCSVRVLGKVRLCHAVPSGTQNAEPRSWSLVPITGSPREMVEKYITTVWDAYGMRDTSFEARAQLRYMVLESTALSNKTLSFSPDEIPTQGKDLFCILLNRHVNRKSDVDHETVAFNEPLLNFNVEDHGIVCESVDQSIRRFRRVGFFKEYMSVDNRFLRALSGEYEGKVPMFDKSRADGRMYFKSDILNHLGFHRHGDEAPVSSLSTVDAETGVRMLGFKLSDFGDRERSLEKIVPQDLVKVDGKLSLFRDGYEEVEMEIM